MDTSSRTVRRRLAYVIAAMGLRYGLCLIEVVTALQDGLTDETDGKGGVKD